MSYKKIGIIVAMDKELEQLQRLFSDGSVVVEKCGIGKVNAALGAAQMINRHHPDAIISSGCAGGNGEGVHIHDIVVSTQLVYHDVYCGTAIDNTTQYGQVQGMPARFDADPDLLRTSLELTNPTTSTPSESGGTVHPGLIATGDWFVDTKEKMRSILERFPEAKAVDMESAAIAQTCYHYGVPFLSFRVISDLPLVDTDASQYHDFWRTVADRSFQLTRTLIERLKATSPSLP
ncbi:MAG: 5'-methylthioadenosine/S-adenosylhomocysteine nucleosidase [Prevotella sp.]|nr:5'-methylthioadenosine/S-adenosylhomocysteine nucleosidase [Prevotella sp.]